MSGSARTRSESDPSTRGDGSTVIVANLMAAVRIKKREKEPEQKEEEELGKRWRRGVIFLFFHASNEGEASSAWGLLPQSEPRATVAATTRRVCLPRIGFAPEPRSLPLSSHTARSSDLRPLTTESGNISALVIIKRFHFISPQCTTLVQLRLLAVRPCPVVSRGTLTRLRRISCRRVPTQLCYAISAPSG
ncbi:hypothetical protein BJX66DRAFT_165594 [Aspergillus keveii]|uniref:Uncharacterized protein n=1 Tax=Aspergillus keveii TaxID=714993 RepID=A0ABR4G9E2_9EURO